MMVKVCGKLVNMYIENIKPAGKAAFDQLVLQVSSNGGKRYNITDVKCFKPEIFKSQFKIGGEVEIPCYQKAWVSKKGNVGINNYLLEEMVKC